MKENLIIIGSNVEIMINKLNCSVNENYYIGQL